MSNDKISRLFSGWEETMIWSCLDGSMGEIITLDSDSPECAAAQLGDFCFLAGVPDARLLDRISATIITPRSREWEALIEKRFGNGAVRGTRYAIKKNTAFDRARLEKLAGAPDGKYKIREFDGEIYRIATAEKWSRDFCANFKNEEDFIRRGMGAAVVMDGRLVAGASSYSVYSGGIEIEVDTLPEHRNRGLASACAAALILKCIDSGCYPSWDAHDLRSVHLAEKLGYAMAGPYTVYTLRREENAALQVACESENMI